MTTTTQQTDAKPAAFIPSMRMAHERHSTMLRGTDRSTFVTADCYGNVGLSWSGAGCSLMSKLTAAEARALAAELVLAADAAEAQKAAA